MSWYLGQPSLILCEHEPVLGILLYKPEYLLQIPGVQLLFLKPRGNQGKRELTLTSETNPALPSWEQSGLAAPSRKLLPLYWDGWETGF